VRLGSWQCRGGVGYIVNWDAVASRGRIRNQDPALAPMYSDVAHASGTE
jgi:hypothetical protein